MALIPKFCLLLICDMRRSLCEGSKFTGVNQNNIQIYEIMENIAPLGEITINICLLHAVIKTHYYFVINKVPGPNMAVHVRPS